MRRTGGGKKCISVCLCGHEAVLCSRDTVEPLQSVTETSITTGLCLVLVLSPHYTQQNQASRLSLCEVYPSLIFPMFNIMFLGVFFSSSYLTICFKNNSAAPGFINMHLVQCKWLSRPPLGR